VKKNSHVYVDVPVIIFQSRHVVKLVNAM